MNSFIRFNSPKSSLRCPEPFIQQENQMQWSTPNRWAISCTNNLQLLWRRNMQSNKHWITWLVVMLLQVSVKISQDQNSLWVIWYPFIQLGRERYCESYKSCLERLILEARTLTMKPQHRPQFGHVNKQTIDHICIPGTGFKPACNWG